MTDDPVKVTAFLPLPSRVAEEIQSYQAQGFILDAIFDSEELYYRARQGDPEALAEVERRRNAAAAEKEDERRARAAEFAASRLLTADEIVHRIAKFAPDEDDYGNCEYCESDASDDPQDHEASCLWRQARRTAGLPDVVPPKPEPAPVEYDVNGAVRYTYTQDES